MRMSGDSEFVVIRLTVARRQDAHPVELATIEQHLAEPQIVDRGRYQSTAAREQRGRLGDVTNRVYRCVGRRIDQAGELFRRHPESGVDHPEWFEQAVAQKLIERLP